MTDVTKKNRFSIARPQISHALNPCMNSRDERLYMKSLSTHTETETLMSLASIKLTYFAVHSLEVRRHEIGGNRCISCPMSRACFYAIMSLRGNKIWVRNAAVRNRHFTFTSKRWPLIK